ncbi:TAXI family TRAP transporter solute-binding subunit [Amycolatopsis sp. H20-H5]|uniref:TAXI family TRAP transporter solute-binding subunit n=1 Tax=Amycolatopsis sp. H20-H5 TaxID=3046309 RepID=UPI003FA37D96
MRGVRGAGALLAAVVAAVGMLAGCAPDFGTQHLRIAAGNAGGVYDKLAQGLATAWSAQLGMDRPEVLQTQGSPDNVNRVLSGDADVAFVAADVAADTSVLHPGRLAALARIHDDYLHVVVRDDAPVTSVAQLRGKRIAIGSAESGVEYIVRKILKVSGLDGTGVVSSRNLGLPEALAALERNEIDAVFWSGGLPTGPISALAGRIKLRLLDIAALMPAMRTANPVYRTATIPSTTYPGIGPVTTLVVPNFLVVRSEMADNLAEALVQGLFDSRDALVQASSAALSIDVHPAIETAPLPLHPGALNYYRTHKA